MSAIDWEAAIHVCNVPTTFHTTLFPSSRVTILKNDKRQSRGVAFIQFLKIEDAESCMVLNNTEVMYSMECIG